MLMCVCVWERESREYKNFEKYIIIYKQISSLYWANFTTLNLQTQEWEGGVPA